MDLKQPDSQGFLASNRENLFWWFLISSASTALIFESTSYLRNELVCPIKNRLKISNLFSAIATGLVGIVVIVVGLALIYFWDIKWLDYTSTSTTLGLGISFAAWLTLLQRLRREVIWRYKGRFSEVEFKVKPSKSVLVSEQSEPEEIEKNAEEPEPEPEVYLCGHFTRWEVNGIKMEKSDDGSYKCKIAIEAGRDYEFKYWVIKGDRSDVWVFHNGEKDIDKESENDKKNNISVRVKRGWNKASCIKIRYNINNSLKFKNKFNRNIYS